MRLVQTACSILFKAKVEKQQLSNTALKAKVETYELSNISLKREVTRLGITIAVCNLYIKYKTRKYDVIKRL
jgi:hypothetical protein